MSLSIATLNINLDDLPLVVTSTLVPLLDATDQAWYFPSVRLRAGLNEVVILFPTIRTEGNKRNVGEAIDRIVLALTALRLDVTRLKIETSEDTVVGDTIMTSEPKSEAVDDLPF